MYSLFITSLRTLNELLTAGIAITAFSLLLYALSFNLRDRVARSFAFILLCVVVVYVADSLASVTASPAALEAWLRLQWPGIIFLPAAYLHFSDALLSTTGRPSRGRRRLAVRLSYLISTLFLLALPFSLLVGPLVANGQPAPHLQRTLLSWIFSLYYLALMIISWINFGRAYNRTVTSTSRRRMRYLITGALAPALGSYPYLLFGSNLAEQFPLAFWVAVTLSNIVISALLVLMAYAVAFFGVPWPDRVVKRRLLKWLLRGPVTASSVLAVTTVINRVGRSFGLSVSAIVAVSMVGLILLMEHMISLASPIWERWLFHGGDREELETIQTLEERLLTQGDMRQFLESVLAAVADRLQVSQAFIAAIGPQGVDLFVTIGGDTPLAKENLTDDMLESVAQNGNPEGLFTWGDYWLTPLYGSDEEEGELIGLLGALRKPGQHLDEEQTEALAILKARASLALSDRRRQQQVFSSLEALTPQVEMIQRLRAAASYDGNSVLAQPNLSLEDKKFSRWVKDALTHYWGGPKLTESPLMGLKLVQEALDEHEGNPTNALRAILRQAVDYTRPEGERRFTAEWILYNILELKFMEGRKVREVAMRLAMSEADLYRKQRVAVEAVANAIVEMERQARAEEAREILEQTQPEPVENQ